MKFFNLLIMRLFILFLMSVIFSFNGCEKTDILEGTPACIKNKITDQKDKSCLDQVYEYEYLSTKVFLFIYPCPEGCFVLVDQNCNDLKDSNGNNICNCTIGGSFCSDDFKSNRKNEKLIWKNR